MNDSHTANYVGGQNGCRLALLITLTLWSISNAFATELKLTPVDREVPDFKLQGVDGTIYQPEILLGKTWLINFWAVWCAPCLDELPSLNKTWAQLESENVGMLAINIGEDADKIEQFLNEHNLQIDFPIVIGDKIRSLGNWSGAGLPFTVIVSPMGKVVYEAVGPREWHEPQFVDAILAVNENHSTKTFNYQKAAVLAQFQTMPSSLKLVAVAILLITILVLVIVFRMFSRRKSAANDIR